MSQAKIDYACAGCGAEAVSVPDPEGRRGPRSRVTVPHKPGCPVWGRLAVVRAKVAAERGA